MRALPKRMKLYGKKLTAVMMDKIYPPHQSLSRQLPPEGKPFGKALLVVHNSHKKKKGLSPLTQIFTQIFKFFFHICGYVLRKTGFPSGGSCRVSD